jgi:diguanylate cyclase (GGDEF)-like protein
MSAGSDETKPRIDNDVRLSNYLSTELTIARFRWLVFAFLGLYFNTLRPAGWPIGLFNGIIAFGAAYNLGIILYIRRAKTFTAGLTLLFMSFDAITVGAGMYYTAGVYSPFLFFWFLTLFTAGARFGFVVSLILQFPMAAFFAAVLIRDVPLGTVEFTNRLTLGLFAIIAASAYGTLFSREEKQHLRLIADYHHNSITDRLTGLYNYSYFVDELQKEHARALRNGAHFSLLLFDLDLFKQVNDTYGHEKGNVLLREVAGIIRSNARRMDTVARYGGEEFVILMPNSNGAEVEMAERIRKKVEEAEFPGIADGPVRITISAGACTYPQDASSVFELLDKADKGLYLAKNTGRNRTCYCKQL